MKVRWTSLAKQDIAGIVRYIRKDSAQAASRVKAKIVTGCAALSFNPKMGRCIDSHGTRELVFYPLPYIAVYQIAAADEIHILRIRHGAQQWPELN
jgi:addiction module RelE/StbE family toxin